MNRLVMAALALFLALPASVSVALADSGYEGLMNALQRGGHVIYLRHMTPDRTQQDASPVQLADCATQRNLGDEGRAEARDLGVAFRALRIPVGQVLSGEFCRALETSYLAFGRAEPAAALLFASELPRGSPEREERTDTLKQLLATPPPAGTNLVLVSHSRNFEDATGETVLADGEAAIFLPGKAGSPTLVARLLPSDWTALAQGAPARPPVADPAALLRRGGHVLYVRHGQPSSVGPMYTAREDLANCEVQRNLADAGRDQARAIGEAFQALHIPVGQVWSSEYCRTLETADLAFARAEPEPALLHLDPSSPAIERAELIAGLLRLLSIPPAPRTNTVLVSHSTNLEFASDIHLEPAEMAIFEPHGSAGFTLVARVPWEEWSALAHAPRAADGQSLYTQSRAIRAMFEAAYGDRAAEQWVVEHEAELVRRRR